MEFCQAVLQGQHKTPTQKMPAAFFVTGATGLEPAISGLTGQRDKPASLRPQKVNKLYKKVKKKSSRRKTQFAAMFITQ